MFADCDKLWQRGSRQHPPQIRGVLHKADDVDHRCAAREREPAPDEPQPLWRHPGNIPADTPNH
jgi:hypothetical protein